MKFDKSKLILLGIIFLSITTFYVSGANEHLTLLNIQKNLELIRNYFENYPGFTLGIFSGLYILMTSLSIPGSIVLTLLSGTIFGIVYGSLLVTACGTVGACIAFLMSRYIFRDTILDRYKDKYKTINRKLEENETTYMLGLRLLPMSPYVVINLSMGVTSLRLWKFAWTTFFGMLPGAFIYVYAGRKITAIKSPSEILTWEVSLTLLLLGGMPFIIKWISNYLREKELVPDSHGGV